ncbi:unnamed protein product [Darwinula stevensoni]|uniref:Peptidase S1 domain-containing protein n=1 Tax=Darwinula stevensoni TaxID=69355 RepID=A0A7R8XDW4_9CRUS|nr:unnamed protein product [Darwinula stevensoni]CAG0893911.1 unnamed protein product [Darwinula stevensoni]
MSDCLSSAFVSSRPACGLGEPGKSAKIVNGEEAGKGEFPWHVGITYKGRFYCGGAVINDRYVLTAAHCVYGINSNRLGIVAREFDRGNPNDLDTLVLKPQRIVIHPNFVRDTFENDVAVVRLDRALPLSGTGEVPPVCLPGASDIHNAFVNETGVVTGWGRVLESGQTSKTLQKVGVPIMSNDDCKTKTSYEAKEILDSMMCAGYKEGGKDACQGDSGGPLHWKSPSGKQYLVGIVSWGRGCARRGLPGVYTRITKFLPWIYDNTPDGCYCREREPRFG